MAKARRKKAIGKKTVRKKALPKKTVRKKAGPKKTVPKKTVRKKAARPARRTAAHPLLPLARRIVHFTTRGERPDVASLYAENCISIEPGQDPAIGREERDARFVEAGKLFQRTSWTLRNQWLGDTTIVLEWDAEIELANGRIVQLVQVAVHEVHDGQITAERVYYDPTLLL